MKKGVIVLCAGNATRSCLGYNKTLFPLGEKNVLERVLDAYADFDYKVIAVAETEKEQIAAIADEYSAIVTLGGATRTQSVRNALSVLPECDVAVIHDGARPFINKETIARAVESAEKFGSGIAAVKATDTVRVLKNGVLSATDRNETYYMQTPQAFSYERIKRAYALVKGDFTDDAEVYSAAGYSPKLCEGDYSNKKLTVPSDFLPVYQSIGTGFDTHRLTSGRPLLLGGVKIPFEKGLLGHSDADVLLHAVCDAVLSAAGLPDIGVLFPDTDEAYLGADSAELLREVRRRAEAVGKKIRYVSAVIMAQKPKLKDYLPSMRRKIAEIMGISENSVNISATTTELLGIIGEGKGIAASAVCLTE